MKQEDLSPAQMLTRAKRWLRAARRDMGATCGVKALSCRHLTSALTEISWAEKAWKKGK